MRRVLLLLAVLLAASPARAAFDSRFAWRTLETENFLVHFHQGGEPAARRAAALAEEARAKLIDRLGWTPAAKTRLVLVDASDSANGYGSPFPYNAMVVFLTPPSENPVFGLTAADDWLRMVITHEYTHVLFLDMARSLPGGIRNVFGRVWFPNLLLPMWMIEGLATYEETELTSGGRGRSPASDMVLRMAVLGKAFPEPDQASVFRDTWPAGETPYLFGESFVRWLAERYGRAKVTEFGVAYSGRWLPFLVESTARRVFGRDFASLWKEWRADLEGRYGEQARKASGEGLTPSAPLTSAGFYTLSPAWSPDGSSIAYVSVNADGFPAIRVARADGSGDRRVVKNVVPLVSSGTSVAWHPDGARIFYTKMELDRRSAVNDIWCYDLARGRERRVTRGLRARDPHVSPDGKRLVFVTGRLGMSRLAVLDLDKAVVKPALEKDVAFLTEEGPTIWSNPRWSPEGSRIAAGVWEPGGGRDIRILDAAGRPRIEATLDRANDANPAWSPDGRFLYFASDRTGIFNLHAWETATGRLYRVTNVLGGAFAPAPSPDGRKLAFAAYGPAGFDIRLMEADPGAWRPAAEFEDPYPESLAEPAPAGGPTRGYNPLSTLWPRLWLPSYAYSSESGSMFGLLTGSQDTVQNHLWLANVLWGPDKKRLAYGLSYTYSGLEPTVGFGAWDTDVVHGGFLEDASRRADYVERERGLDFAVAFPFDRMASSWRLTLGYNRRELSALSDLPPWEGYAGALPAEGTLASARLSLAFADARQYGMSVSPEGGRAVTGTYERFDESWGSDFRIDRYTLDWREYLDLPWRHHVLAVHLHGGASRGDRLPQRPFSLGGDEEADLASGDEAVFLRGYPAKAFRGEKICLGSLEYRFPLKNIERGWKLWPVFFRRAHGAVFFEAGNAWDGRFESSELKKSAGLEARLDMTLGYWLPLTARIVLARGFDEEGIGSLYLSLQLPLGSLPGLY